MGCDIHAQMEKKGPSRYRWVHAGDPEIGRNYELFAVLSGVRNRNGITPISEPKGLPKDHLFNVNEDLDDDYHSYSWVTLKELKSFDLNQEHEDNRYILSRDANGEISSVCADTKGEHQHLGRVGKVTRIFSVFGTGDWDDLINKMERCKDKEDMTDEDVRLVFFFDN